MIIELYGLPATGKTQLAKLIEDKSNFRIVKIKNKTELIFLNVKFFFKKPYLCIVNFWLILANSKNFKDWYFKITNCFLQHNAKYEKARKLPNAMIDQGHHQNVLSVFNSKVSDKFLEWYLKLLPNVDLLVVRSLPLDNWEEKIKERGYFIRNKKFDKNSIWVKVLISNDSKTRKYLELGQNTIILPSYLEDFNNAWDIIKKKIKS